MQISNLQGIWIKQCIYTQNSQTATVQIQTPYDCPDYPNTKFRVKLHGIDSNGNGFTFLLNPPKVDVLSNGSLDYTKVFQYIQLKIPNSLFPN